MTFERVFTYGGAFFVMLPRVLEGWSRSTTARNHSKTYRIHLPPNVHWESEKGTAWKHSKIYQTRLPPIFHLELGLDDATAEVSREDDWMLSLRCPLRLAILTTDIDPWDLKLWWKDIVMVERSGQWKYVLADIKDESLVWKFLGGCWVVVKEERGREAMRRRETVKLCITSA